VSALFVCFVEPRAAVVGQETQQRLRTNSGSKGSEDLSNLQFVKETATETILILKKEYHLE